MEILSLIISSLLKKANANSVFYLPFFLLYIYIYIYINLFQNQNTKGGFGISQIALKNVTFTKDVVSLFISLLLLLLLLNVTTKYYINIKWISST
jgi:hypothetical protein